MRSVTSLKDWQMNVGAALTKLTHHLNRTCSIILSSIFHALFNDGNLYIKAAAPRLQS